MNRRAFIKRAALAAAVRALPWPALRSEITHYADFPVGHTHTHAGLVEAFWPMPVIPPSEWAELWAMQRESNNITSAIVDIERIAWKTD